MGTRHSIIAIVDGETKLAQYGQWDGYLGGVGSEVLDFLKEAPLDKFKEQVRTLQEMTDERRKQVLVELGADPNKDKVPSEIAQEYFRKYPQMSRDMSAKILPLILDGSVKDVALDKTFPADSLFCEYAYVIDFDKNTFEAYKGFNKEPLDPSERFASLPREKETSEYYQCKLLKSFSLFDLPTEEEFLAIQKNEEEDEDVL